MKIKQQGHQHYCEIEGNFVRWTETVESFGGKPMQVPAVIIEKEGEFSVIPLRKEGYWYEISDRGEA